ncbi:hypothetical protein [Hydrocarboniphaga effusa]|jgi:hypothetical protein|uniref:hypothetical protein n=1 Tax=Hydrocarboniphaga effusa TaxID=243629 RepID=UPI0031377BB4
MNTLLVQTLIVFVCVLSAVVYVLARYLPRKQIANWLDAHGYAQSASLLRPAKGGGGCHSGDDGGCSSCGSCASAEAPKREAVAGNEHPLHFHPKR